MRKRIRNIIIAIVLAAVFVGLFIYGTGLEAKEQSAPTDSLMISEFMASNKSTIADGNGEFSDWIEIYNPTDKSVNLFSYGLSDDSTDIKWTFPEVVLEPGQYTVVFAASKSSKTNGVYHTGFKLNAEKGSIFLTTPAGQTIDSVDYKDQLTGISAGRDADGNWAAMEPSPGFSNDEAGVAAFLESRKTDDDTIIITEVMSQNRTTIADSEGVYNDYIEIYNNGNASVNLAGYKLSDKTDNIAKWAFPDISIEPGQYLLVFATGLEVPTGEDLQANFRISSLEETIVLSNPMGMIVDSVTLREVDTDWSYARVLQQDGTYSDEWEKTAKPTPGLVNSSDGFASFMKDNVVATGDIIINEVMVSNGDTLQEGDGEYYDWIELYNRSGQAIDLTGYSLSDDQNNPSKYKFEDSVLEPGQYLILMASGDSDIDDAKKKYAHTNFRLSGEGEVLALYNDNGALQDRFILTYMPRDMSIGRVNDKNELFYFEKPSPNGANDNAYAGILDAPVADMKAGSYDSGVTVSLSCSQPDAKIYYTLDGSEPSDKDKLYTQPISIPQTGMVRARAYSNGYIRSEISTSTYFVGETHSLPLLSVVTESDYLFDEQTGIYELGPDAVELLPHSPGHYKDANYTERGKESERPASFEVFDESGARVFAQNIGIRIQGGFSRDHAQKSFAIFARGQYGPTTMQYSFFDNRPFTEYKSLQLRQGGQDSNITKIREATLMGLVEGQGFNFLNQAIKPYVLYINGEYWGVYYMQEKRNEHFIAQHEGIDNPDDLNILKATSIVLQGSNTEYKKLLDYIKNNDMSKEENFNHIAQYIDTDSFMDLMIHQVWNANSDYANLQFYQVLPDGKWKQIYYDFCWTFQSGHPTLERRMLDKTTGSSLFNGLLAYKPWRDKYIERFAWVMKEIYDPERVIAEIDRQAALIADEIPAERAKYGGTVSNWEANVQKMREFAKVRNGQVVEQLKSTFNLSAEQIKMLEDAIAQD